MKLAALSLVLVASAAHAQFKCTGADGSVSFQQAPCAASARAERLNLPEPPKRTALEQAVEWAIANRRVLPGMNRGELKRVMRADPDRVNTTVAGGVRTEQQIYRRTASTVYVYLDDGIVSAVQVTER